MLGIGRGPAPREKADQERSGVSSTRRSGSAGVDVDVPAAFDAAADVVALDVLADVDVGVDAADVLLAVLDVPAAFEAAAVLALDVDADVDADVADADVLIVRHTCARGYAETCVDRRGSVQRCHMKEREGGLVHACIQSESTECTHTCTGRMRMPPSHHRRRNMRTQHHAAQLHYIQYTYACMRSSGHRFECVFATVLLNRVDWGSSAWKLN